MQIQPGQNSTETASSKGASLAGYALVGGVCTNKNKFSLIGDRGFSSVSIVTHELGHNIGLQHDGINSKSQFETEIEFSLFLSISTDYCNKSQNYIMTPVVGLEENVLNGWYFSPCSRSVFRLLITSITNKIEQNYTCLTNTPRNLPGEVEYDYSPYLPGQLWTVDQQCQVATSSLKSSAMPCGVSDRKFLFISIINPLLLVISK